MAAANSTEYKFSIGSTPVAIACQRDVSWEINREMVDVACKDFNGFAKSRPGAKSGSISVSGIIDLAAASGASSENLAAGLLAGTLLTVECTSSEIGAYGLTGTAYVETFSCNAPGIEQPVEFSATLRMDGSFTVG